MTPSALRIVIGSLVFSAMIAFGIGLRTEYLARHPTPLPPVPIQNPVVPVLKIPVKKPQIVVKKRQKRVKIKHVSAAQQAKFCADIHVAVQHYGLQVAEEYAKAHWSLAKMAMARKCLS